MLGARKVGRYRVEDASPTDGVVAGTPGSVLAGTTIGVVAGTITGAVAGTPGMDAAPAKRDKVDDARPIAGDGEEGAKQCVWRNSASVSAGAGSWRGIQDDPFRQDGELPSCRAHSPSRPHREIAARRSAIIVAIRRALSLARSLAADHVTVGTRR